MCTPQRPPHLCSISPHDLKFGGKRYPPPLLTIGQHTGVKQLSSALHLQTNPLHPAADARDEGHICNKPPPPTSTVPTLPAPHENSRRSGRRPGGQNAAKSPESILWADRWSNGCGPIPESHVCLDFAFVSWDHPRFVTRGPGDYCEAGASCADSAPCCLVYFTEDLIRVRTHYAENRPVLIE